MSVDESLYMLIEKKQTSNIAGNVENGVQLLVVTAISL